MWRGNVRTSEGKRQEQMSQTLEYELYDESTVHETAVLRQVSEIGTYRRWFVAVKFVR